MFLTIFTPTYNRANKLFRAYESLKTQTFKDFEWLIIDDGSTDNTEEIVQNFIRQSPEMIIRYCKIKHGGKHFAMNKSYDLAQGEFYMSLDSDDYFSNEQSLQILYDNWNNLTEEQKEEYSGILAYYIDQSDNILGYHFDKPKIFDFDLYKEIVFEHKYDLNTPGMTKTKILAKEYFPEINDNLSYFPEWIIWMRLYTKHNAKYLLIPDTIYRYNLNGEERVSNTTPQTKALYYQSLYQLNEWSSLFAKQYPIWFMQVCSSYTQQCKRWNISFFDSFNDLNLSAKIFLLKFYLKKLLSIQKYQNRILIYILGIKITFNNKKDKR